MMLPKVNDFYNGGLWGKFSFFTDPNDFVMTLPKAAIFYNGGPYVNSCRNWMKFRLWVRLKPSNERGESELDWARCNKNIAENSFSLGHGTDNTSLTHYLILRNPIWSLSTGAISWIYLFNQITDTTESYLGPFYLVNFNFVKKQRQKLKSFIFARICI